MIQTFRAIPVDRLKLLVFDLDGTLIDSAQDLCNCVNATLIEFALPALPDPAIAGFVGNGAPALIRRSLAMATQTPPEDVDQQRFAKAYEFFLQYYREHKLDFTYAYAGVLESLIALHKLHDEPSSLRDEPSSPRRAMAVLTNKPVRPARGICEGLGLADYFLHIYGGDSFPLKKPDPMGLRSLIEETNSTPGETVMIGDSQVDVETARNAGAWAIGCTFGFGPLALAGTQPDILVDSPVEWTEVLLPQAIKRVL